jgi:hypothetical protein
MAFVVLTALHAVLRRGAYLTARGENIAAHMLR